MTGNRLIAARELRRQYELLGPRQTCQHLCEALRQRQLLPEDFSLRDLAENLVQDGREWVRSLQPGREEGTVLRESSAVDTSTFSNVTGQIVYSKIADAFNSEEIVFSKLVTTIPTRLNGERIAGISRIGDEAEIVDEGRPFPLAGVSEDYIDTPATTKRGMIVPVTKEAIFFDRTGVLLSRCAEVGEFLAINKEKRVIDAILDENAGATTGGHRYKWKGTTYATYQSSTPWINVKTTNALVDWTQIEQAELVLASITDPFTGEPVLSLPDTLVVAPNLLHTARRIVNATNIRVAAGGFATSGTLYQTDGPNTLTPYRIVSSRLLKARMALATNWYLGNLEKAVAYMENWGLTVVQAPDNSEAEFTQDIVARYKASERGAAVVLEPRVLCKNSA